MSYALQRFSGFGATAAPQTCGANSAFNASTNNCDCLPGFEWVNEADSNNFDCKPAVCNGVNEAKSPVDGRCHCLPGFRADDNNACTLQGLSKWFPGCVDAKGNKVPGCVAGFSPMTMAPWIAGGAVVGLVLGAVLFR